MKKIIFVATALFIIVLICGCATHPAIIWDESLPEEETVTIYWVTMGSNVQPAAYNGVNVDWQIKKSGWNPIIIPAGTVTFELKGTEHETDNLGNISRRTTYTWHGISFFYDFEKGREYTVSVLYGALRILNGKTTRSDVIEVFVPDWERK